MIGLTWLNDFQLIHMLWLFFLCKFDTSIFALLTFHNWLSNVMSIWLEPKRLHARNDIENIRLYTLLIHNNFLCLCPSISDFDPYRILILNMKNKQGLMSFIGLFILNIKYEK